MTIEYLCKKCMFKTNNFNDLKRHLNKKNKCKKNLESFNYSDDQLLVLTLLPHEENNEKNKEEVEYLKKSDLIFKNKDKLFDDIKIIDKTKAKKCIYCTEEFSKIHDLKKHLLVYCFYKELQKKNVNENKLNISNLTSSLNTNSLNTTNTNSNNITTNIYLEIKSPVPFDSEWDVSQIDKFKKEHIAFSNFMYTKLLEEILKNEINLNVIIDKNNDSGIVYKNDIDKYIQMRSKDIVDNTMDKLKRHLLEINNNSRDSILLDCLDVSKKIIENKHDNYVNNETIQKGVKDVISNIFENKKEKAIDISNNLKDNIFENLDKGF
jgi:hypothetical protein